VLDFFLRYLKSSENADGSGQVSEAWLGDTLGANENQDIQKGVEAMNKSRAKKHNEGGFGWRSGKERCTTGIWM
jgi:hypothetical protein